MAVHVFQINQSAMRWCIYRKFSQKTGQCRNEECVLFVGNSVGISIHLGVDFDSDYILKDIYQAHNMGR